MDGTTIVALLYDFDRTLCTQDMQNYAFIPSLGMDPEDYWWYCDLRKYGTCRHAGYGMGFERMVMYLTGVGNIRDVLPHPRTVGSADF